MKRLLAEEADLLAPTAVERFFRELYRRENLDRNGVMPLLTGRSGLDFAFATAAEKFQMIEDDRDDVIVPYSDKAAGLIAALRNPDPPLALRRRLQAFTVPVNRAQYKALLAEVALEILHGRYTVLTNRDRYDDKTGLQP